jgi:hypothetical protein
MFGVAARPVMILFSTTLLRERQRVKEVQGVNSRLAGSELDATARLLSEKNANRAR